MAKLTVVRQGANKPDPFTVLVVANPVLEAPLRSNQFVPDPILANRQGFDDCVRYVEQSLFGTLPGQVEPILADPALSPHVRMLSLFPAAAGPAAKHSFVANDATSTMLVARRGPIADWLKAENIVADVVYAISASTTHARATAWFTSDDDAKPGVPFTLDSITFSHRHHYLIPGTIAMHFTADSLTAVHEFQHAVSSYSNGQIVDLYVDSPPGVNNKSGRPIPGLFGDYNQGPHLSDPTRSTMGYPPSWMSFHCALHDAGNPAIMDNYHSAPGGAGEVCQNDTITRLFVRDRILAKIGR